MADAEAASVGATDARAVANEWIFADKLTVDVMWARTGMGLTLTWWVVAKRIGSERLAVNDVVITGTSTDKAVWM